MDTINKRSKTIQIVVGIVIILLAVLAARTMKTLKKPPQRQTTQSLQKTLVQTHWFEPQTTTLNAIGYGTIEAWQRLPVVAQVSGQITQMPTTVQPGQRFESGELILKIDPTEYQHQLNVQQAELARAELALKEETGKQAVAEKEWQLLVDQDKSSAIFDNELQKELALRTAQLEEKTRLLAAAKSAVKLAELSLARTNIFAPCDGVALEVFVAKNQVVSQGSSLLTYVCLDQYKIIASLTEDQMRLLPSWSPNTELKASVFGQEARALYQLPALEGNTQMQQVLIAIDPKDNHNDFKLGQYTQVKISGRSWENIYTLPEQALRENNQVWLIENDQLVVKSVQVIHAENHFYSVQDPLMENKPWEVIISSINSPYQGMPLARVQAQRDSSEDTADANTSSIVQ